MLGAAIDVVAVVAVVFVGICSDSPRPKKSGLLGVCGDVDSRLSSLVAFAVRLVKSGDGWSRAAVAVASETDRLLEGVPMKVSIAMSLPLPRPLSTPESGLLLSLRRLPLMIEPLWMDGHGASAYCPIVVVVVLLLSPKSYESRPAVLVQLLKAILSC